MKEQISHQRIVSVRKIPVIQSHTEQDHTLVLALHSLTEVYIYTFSVMGLIFKKTSQNNGKFNKIEACHNPQAKMNYVLLFCVCVFCLHCVHCTRLTACYMCKWRYMQDVYMLVWVCMDVYIRQSECVHNEIVAIGVMYLNCFGYWSAIQYKRNNLIEIANILEISCHNLAVIDSRIKMRYRIKV